MHDSAKRWLWWVASALLLLIPRTLPAQTLEILPATPTASSVLQRTAALGECPRMLGCASTTIGYSVSTPTPEAPVWRGPSGRPWWLLPTVGAAGGAAYSVWRTYRCIEYDCHLYPEVVVTGAVLGAAAGALVEMSLRLFE